MSEIRATFVADFSEFDKACEKSRAELEALEKSADKAGSATDQMVQKAASRAADLSSSLGTASTAAEDFGTSVVSAADVAQQEFQSLPSTLDKVRGGLNEVAESAGFTFTQLGLLKGGAIVVGTALASWEIGRTVAEFFDLDEKIAHTTATLMGWGDAVKEAAGSKADALEKASRAAGREITDLSEALRINGATVTAWNEVVSRADAPKESVRQIERWNQELDKMKNAGVLTALTADLESHNFTLAFLSKTYGISVEALQFYQREMKNAADGSKAWRAELAEQSKAESETAERRRKEAAATFAEVTKVERDAHALSMNWVKELGEAQAKANMDQMRVTVKSINDTTALEREANTLRMSLYATDTEMKIQKTHDWYDAEVAALSKSDENYERHVAALLDMESLKIQAIENTASITAAKTEESAARQVAAINQVTQSYFGAIDAAAKLAGVTVTGNRAPYLDAAGNWVDESKTSSASTPGGGSVQFSSSGPTDPRILSLMAVGYTLGEAQAMIGGYGTHIGDISHRASGGPVSAGAPYIVGERGPELFVPSNNGSITPSGGPSVVNHIYVNGTAADVARQVADEILRTIKSGSGKLAN